MSAGNAEWAAGDKVYFLGINILSFTPCSVWLSVRFVTTWVGRNFSKIQVCAFEFKLRHSDHWSTCQKIEWSMQNCGRNQTGGQTEQEVKPNKGVNDSIGKHVNVYMFTNIFIPRNTRYLQQWQSQLVPEPPIKCEPQSGWVSSLRHLCLAIWHNLGRQRLDISTIAGLAKDRQ